MKTLWLHIGTMKTGTSALQQFFCENREVLREHGYDYPDMPFYFPGLRGGGRKRNAHFILYKNGACDGHGDWREEGYGLLDASFETYDDVILSDENIWEKFDREADEPLAKLCGHAGEAGFTVKVVVYLRRQDRFAVSRYAQAVERFLGTHFEAWFEQNRWTFDYKSMLSKIADLVGGDNIVVRVYDRSALDAAGGIHADFLSAVGIDSAEGFEPPMSQVNPSLSANLIEIRRITNVAQGLADCRDIVFVNAAIRCAKAGSPAPSRPFASAERLRELLAGFEEGNAWVSREFLHTDEPLFDAGGFDEREPWVFDNPWLPGDVVTYFQQVSTLQTSLIMQLSDGTEPPVETPGGMCPGWLVWCQSYDMSDATDAYEGAIRAVASFFVRRQEAIRAGEVPAPVTGDEVACLVQGLLSRAGLPAQSALAQSHQLAVLSEHHQVLLERHKALREDYRELRNDVRTLEREVDFLKSQLAVDGDSPGPSLSRRARSAALRAVRKARGDS